MDGRACATFRGLPCVDGSFLERPNEIAASASVSPPDLPPSQPSSQLTEQNPAARDGGPDRRVGAQAAAAATKVSGSPSSDLVEPRRVKEDATLEQLLPTVVADHKLDDGLADRQFLRLKPGPELVRALIERGKVYAQENSGRR
jgi:hypothetical protein